MDELRNNGNDLPVQMQNDYLYRNIRNTLSEARSKVHITINVAMVEAYWDIGRQIDEAIGKRAEYGKGLLKYLATQLTAEFGKGFDESSLRRMRQFFKTFPNRATLWRELSWSHYRLLMLYLPTEEELKHELMTEQELIERKQTTAADEED